MWLLLLLLLRLLMMLTSACRLPACLPAVSCGSTTSSAVQTFLQTDGDIAPPKSTRTIPFVIEFYNEPNKNDPNGTL